MFKMLIGMIKMKAAFKKAANDDLVSWPEGHEKLVKIFSNMGDMGPLLEYGTLLFLLL